MAWNIMDYVYFKVKSPKLIGKSVKAFAVLFNWNRKPLWCANNWNRQTKFVFVIGSAKELCIHKM